MLISRKRNFIFIHIYKNAGTSITTTLLPHAVNYVQYKGTRVLKKFNIPVPFAIDPQPMDHHVTAGDIIDVMGRERFDRYFSFAIIRNPWDWQLSFYKYVLKIPRHYQHDLIKSFSSFDEYIKWRCREEVRLQKDFIYSPEGELLVDFVGRFETLKDDFRTICSRIGISTGLKKKNVSNTRPYREFYNDESHELIREAFSEDIALFGYDF